VVFFDGRNAFEAQIGRFKDAIVPDVATTHDFIKELESGKYDDLKDKPVVTYCTGGIRCEVLSSLMVNRGFKEVYQLDGGIVRYGETFKDQGLWEGSLYVFDKRMHLEFSEDAKTIGECVRCAGAHQQVRELLQPELPHPHPVLRRVRLQPGNPALPGRLRGLGSRCRGSRVNAGAGATVCSASAGSANRPSSYVYSQPPSASPAVSTRPRTTAAAGFRVSGAGAVRTGRGAEDFRTLGIVRL
jgi:rhodanese-related sulfurtransferase